MLSVRHATNLSLDDLISNLKSAFSGRSVDVIKAMWDGNPLLRAWYSGQQVNFGNTHAPDMRAISLDGLISTFKSALMSQTPYVIKAMWNGNPLLRAWYRGQQVNFGNTHAPDMRVISLDDLISNFKSALSSQTPYVIKAMWDGSPLLRAWYSGQQVNFGNTHAPDMRAISLDDLISNFKSAFPGRSVNVIKAMWDGNPLLRAWYSGQQVNFGNTHAPDMRVISLDDLISNFKSALASHCKDVIKAMWDGNLNLHGAIRHFDFSQSKLLLKKVMSSSKSGKSNFITQYVGWLDNTHLINTILEDIKRSCGNKAPSNYKTNQISVLQSRLDELRDTRHHDEIAVEASRPEITVGNSEKITAITQNITLRKRKATSRPKSTGGKKQRTEITQSELSDLVRKLPTQLNGKNYFCVEQLLGQDLQKLTNEIKDEMGIKVRKMRKESNYKVQILDQSKYSTAWKKHSHQSPNKEYCDHNIGNSQPDLTYSQPHPEALPNNLDDLDTLDEDSRRILEAYFESDWKKHSHQSPNKEYCDHNIGNSQPDLTYSQPHPEALPNSLDDLDTLDGDIRRILEAYFESEKMSEDILSFNPSIELSRPPITTPDTDSTIIHHPTSSPTLFNHRFNVQRGNTFVSQPPSAVANKNHSMMDLEQDNDQNIELNTRSPSSSWNSF